MNESRAHTKKLKSIVETLLPWFAQNARELPWRRTREPYGIWIAEIMLQQTQVKTVLPYWTRWMRELPTIESVAQAGLDLLHKLWEGLGYYTRVRNLQRAAQEIVCRHDGRFPENFDDVLALPGIGRYTAGAICSIAFNQPTPVLDGNVIRVLTRVYGIRGDPRSPATNARLWTLAEQLVHTVSAPTAPNSNTHHGARSTEHATRNTEPSTPCSSLNQGLMELGALICTPKAPQCLHCPLRRLCTAHRQGRVQQLPNLGRRPGSSSKRFIAFVAENRGRYLVRRRPAGIVNGGLWEFPNLETKAANGNIAKLAQRFLGASDVRLEPLITLKHTITRYRITLEVQLVRGRIRHQSSADRWLYLDQLAGLPFPSAHRKIVSHLARHRPSGAA